VWVICDQGPEREINFPVPYLNNYTVHGLDLTSEKKRKFMKWVFGRYERGGNHSLQTHPKRNVKCPYQTCGAVFNLHSVIKKEGKIVCPTCLKRMVFRTGFSPLARERKEKTPSTLEAFTTA